MADFEVTGEASLGPDHLIEDVTAIIDKLDELDTKIDELDTKIDELSRKDVRIAVVIDGIDKLDELKIWLDDLDSHDYIVKIKVDIQDKDKLDALYLDILELELTDHNVDVKVKVDGIADAAAKIEALSAAEKRLDDQNKKTKDSTGGFAFSLAMLAPLAIPASAAILSIVGAAGGLAAALGTLVVPALAFGLAAKSMESEASKLVSSLNKNTQAALDNATSYGQIYSILNKNSSAFRGMDSALQGVVIGYVQLKNAVSQFQQAVQLPVAWALYQIFGILRTVITAITPAVYNFGMAFDGVLQDLSNRLHDPTFTKFFKDMSANIGVLTKDWLGGVVNIVEGITALLDAFLPLGVKMSGGFLNMTKTFDTWAQHLAQSEGFKKFINTVQTDGPLILNILGQVVGIVVKLVGALGESKGNAGFLKFLDDMLKTLNGFMGTHQGLTTTAADIGLIGLAAVKLGPALGPILSFLATPAGAVVGVIVALGAAFLYAYTHVKSFHDWVNSNLLPLFNKLKNSVLDMKNWFISIWPEIQSVWQKYGGNILAIIMNAFKTIEGFIEAAMKIIKGIIDIVLGLLSGNWSQVWKGIKEVVVGIWDAILTAAKYFINFFKNIFEMMWKFVSTLFDSALRGIEHNFDTNMKTIEGWVTNAYHSVINTVKQWMADFATWIGKGITNVGTFFTNLPGNILKWIGDIGSLLINAGVNLIQGFINGIENMFGSVQSTLSSLTNFLTSWKGPPSKDKTLLYNSGQMIIDGFVNGLESRYSKVSSSLGGLTKSVGSQFGNQFTTDISAKLNASLNSKVNSTSMGTGGNMAAGTSVNYGGVTINNPKPEPASQTLTKMLQSTAAFGIVQAPMGANFPGG